jgi:hypothetical protein
MKSAPSETVVGSCNSFWLKANNAHSEKNKPFEGISSYGWLAIIFVVFFISNILGLRY